MRESYSFAIESERDNIKKLISLSEISLNQ